ASTAASLWWRCSAVARLVTSKPVSVAITMKPTSSALMITSTSRNPSCDPARGCPGGRGERPQPAGGAGPSGARPIEDRRADHGLAKKLCMVGRNPDYVCFGTRELLLERGAPQVN